MKNPLFNGLVAKVLFCFLFFQSVSAAQVASADGDDLLAMSLEELMDIDVFSASKKNEKAKDVAAAVFVITQDDIRRSTANNVAELLRMVPGVNVAAISKNTWSISVRGFNGRFSNKLLVLMDGKTVYNPVFSGVYWNVVDTVLEDIEKIEVIRGPGGVLWGANAVNGIINIITKNASDTQGLLVSAGGGSEENAFGTLRYGHKIGESAFRAYAKYYDRDPSANSAGDDAFDETAGGFAGFRGDIKLSEKDTLFVQGQVSDMNEEKEYDVPSKSPPPFSNIASSDADHLNISALARWDRKLSDDSSFMVQTYFIHEDREDSVAEAQIDTYDIELQYDNVLSDNHSISLGSGFRYIEDKFRNEDFGFIAQPLEDQYYVGHIFVQDSIQLLDSLRIILGAKLSYNDFSNFEFQPNARGVWKINEKNTLWAAVSRAVRTPNRTEHNVGGAFASMLVPDTGPVVTHLIPNPDFESESMIAYELGYRADLARRVYVDVSAFYYDYDDLASFNSSLAPSVDFSSGSLVINQPILFDNGLEGENYGAELVVNVQPLDWLRMQATYSYLNSNLESKIAGGQGGGLLDEQDENAEHQFGVRTFVDLPWNLEFDGFLRYVDRLSQPNIDSYAQLDLRLGWSPCENVSIDIIGNNLLEGETNEFNDTYPTSIDTHQERGVFGKVTVTY